MGRPRVLLAMSGGLDSSAAAILLLQQGYEIVAITMKTWDYSSSDSHAKETGCCSLDSINDARLLAVTLGFPHYVVDIRQEFHHYVVKDFVEQYLAGRTPNPCVLCNTHIKWAALLKRADALGCDFIATGHYARVREENGRYVLYKGADADKDQSYVLWGLTQPMLRRTLFPLGEFLKPQIRKIAADAGFDHIANKAESYEICFIPDNDYRNFLKKQLPGLEEKLQGGIFVDSNGKFLGKHNGYPFYTIGQRKGLNIPMSEPLYVKKIDPFSNTIVLGKKTDLLSNKFSIAEFNYIKFELIRPDLQPLARIRYKEKAYKAAVVCQQKEVNVDLYEAVPAITPGQSAVLYHGDDVLGGGFINKVF
jgi:tRNA-uridine 2-sulfurtransferase